MWDILRIMRRQEVRPQVSDFRMTKRRKAASDANRRAGKHSGFDGRIFWFQAGTCRTDSKGLIVFFAGLEECVGKSRLTPRKRFLRRPVEDSGDILVFSVDRQRKNNSAATFFVIGDTNCSLLLFDDVAT